MGSPADKSGSIQSRTVGKDCVFKTVCKSQEILLKLEESHGKIRKF